MTGRHSADPAPPELLAVVAEFTRDASGWWDRPDAVRAFLYTLLERASSGVHDAEGDRPFTIAVRPQPDHLRVRLTALNAGSSRILREALASAGGGIRFGDSTTRLIRIPPTEPPLASTATYADMLAAPFAAAAPLNFITPTAFKVAGDRHLPLPDPDILLAGWRRRWNRWCGDSAPAIDEATLTAVQRGAGLARARVDTTAVRLGRGLVIGFTGAVVLRALHPDRWSPDERRAFAALLAFSAYAGTGVRTTEGLGLTLPGDASSHQDVFPPGEKCDGRA